MYTLSPHLPMTWSWTHFSQFFISPFLIKLLFSKSTVKSILPYRIVNSQTSPYLTAALDMLIIPSFLKLFLHLVSKTPFCLSSPQTSMAASSYSIAFLFYPIFLSSKHYRVPSDLFSLLYAFPHDLIQTHTFKYHLYADGSKIYIFSSDLLPELPSSLDSHLHWDL